MLATEVELFIWDKSYDNHEQVRPYMADFLRVYAEVVTPGGIAYNDSFLGRIPGVAGSPNEETGIYMLQNLRSRDEKDAQVTAFRESGGIPVRSLEVGKEYRGTLAKHGWYIGGTGYGELNDLRVMFDYDHMDQPRLKFKRPRERKWRTVHMSVDGLLFREGGK